MAENTKISWTHHTFNPWLGCTKVHAGCTNCYAEAFNKRTGKAKWGDQGTRIKTSDANWKLPLKWNTSAAAGYCPKCNGKGWVAADHQPKGITGKIIEPCEPCLGTGKIGPHRRRVFCASLADVFEDWKGPVHDHRGERLFHPQYSDEGAQTDWVTMDDMRAQLFRLIDATPNLDWLLLTKRPENVGRMWPQEDDGANGKLAEAIFGGRGKLVRRRDNIWIGTSISDQETADMFVPRLLANRNLAPVLFLSAEPLLGPIDLRYIHFNDATFDSLTLTCCPFHDASSRELNCAGPGCNGIKIDWLIIGGESGARHRPMDLDWARSLRDQCHDAEVPVFFKQSGGKYPGTGEELDGEIIHQLPGELSHA